MDARCVMTGSLPPPFIRTFVRRPLFCHRPLCGLDYSALRWPANPISHLSVARSFPLALCDPACGPSSHVLWMYVVVHVHACVCVCLSPHVYTRRPGGSSSILVVLLLIGRHLIPPPPPREGLVEAAISTQRSPQAS